MLAPVFTAHRGLSMAQITVRLLGVGLLLSLLSACAPGPSITLLHEGPRPLDAYRGQWLYVNYWAEWCAPCLEEIPELNAFHRADNGAEVLGINFDQVDSALMPSRRRGCTLPFPSPSAIQRPCWGFRRRRCCRAPTCLIPRGLSSPFSWGLRMRRPCWLPRARPSTEALAASASLATSRGAGPWPRRGGGFPLRRRGGFGTPPRRP